MATPYEVLGVGPGSDPAEIRRAYLRAARRNHPDVAGPAGDERMREINGAWAVLSDPIARRRLDLAAQAGSAPGATAAADASGFTINPLDDGPFVPYDDSDDEDDWRFEPDEFDPATAPSNLMKFLPVTLMSGALFIGMVGVVMSLTALIAAAFVLAVVAAVSFVVAPLVAMGKAAANERRDEGPLP